MPAIANVKLNIRTFCRKGRLKEAMRILLTAPIATVDSSTYLHLLQSCIGKNALPQGKQIHSHINSRGLAFATHTIIQNKLIDMYIKCGSLLDVDKVFDHLAEPNIFSWNMIITAHRRHGFFQKAFSLFRQMQRAATQPDQFTFTGILPACAKMGALEQGMEIHRKIVESNFLSDSVVVNALMDMYSKCGRILYAHKLFDKMAARNVVSWTAIIAGYAQNGFVELALDVFKKMQLAGVKPNLATFTSVLPACAKLGALEQGISIHQNIIRRKYLTDVAIISALVDMNRNCGSPTEARHVFYKMPVRDLISWNAMIAGYAHSGYYEESLDFFRQMQLTNMKPNNVTLASVLPVVSHLSNLQQGKEIHVFVIRNGFESFIIVMNALVDMYNKCGSME